MLTQHPATAAGERRGRSVPSPRAVLAIVLAIAVAALLLAYGTGGPDQEPVDQSLVDEELVDEGLVDEEPVDEGLVDEEPVDQGATITVRPGQSITSALRDAKPGDDVVLRPGVHDATSLESLSLTGVTLRGASRQDVVLEGLSLEGVSGLTVSSMTIVNDKNSETSAVHVSDGSRDLHFQDLTITPRVFSALDLWATTRRITLSDSVLSGSKVKGKRARNGSSYGVRINGAPYDDVDIWPTDILIERNKISGFAVDLIQVGGGRRVTIRNNDLRDPQRNDEHNDGVQSYGSDQLRIEGNRFSASGPNGPNQAIMLAHHPSVESLRVRRTTVTGNLVVSWRGTGINVAGTKDTSVVGNTVAPTGNRNSPGSSIAIHGDNPSLQLLRNVADRVYAPD